MKKAGIPGLFLLASFLLGGLGLDLETMEKFHFSRLVISGQSGGAGKTLFTLGLLGALKKRGLEVVPFKKGPDYIDAGWLSFAARGPCYNLDPFFMSPEVIKASFLLRQSEGRLAVIEGNRGLLDGVDIEGSCSTAQLARILRAPVILVLNCTKVTRSLAAFVKGCQVLEPDLSLAGVVLNQIVRTRHERIIRQTIERYTGLKVLGILPRLKDFSFPMRHLGLLPWQEHGAGEEVVERLATIVEENVDLRALIELASTAPPLEGKPLRWPHQTPEVIIGVFRDRAFQFYYPENFEALRAYGAEIIEFDSFSLRRLPQVDLLYIGGGFPETQAEALVENRDLRQDLREAAEAGLPIYAECGGLMFLGEHIYWQGKRYPMVGALPVDFEVCEKPQGHGYVKAKVTGANPFYSPETSIVGHEFHYSRPINLKEEDISFAFSLLKGHGFGQKRDGLVYRNILGAYTHIHVLGQPEWASALVKVAQAWKKYKLGPLHYFRRELEEGAVRELQRG